MAFAIFFTDDFDKQTVTVTHPVTNRDIMVCYLNQFLIKLISFILFS